MVDNRQLLKNKVEADIKNKIQNAQAVLNDLQNAVQHVQENSTKAKGEVDQAFQDILQLIGNRKTELTRQIEIICHKQISSLQFEIQSIYLALGSLQSTLSNLDSFDHTQLLSLHIPSVLQTPISTPPPVEINLNKLALAEIKKWGSAKLPSATKQSLEGFEISDMERVLRGVRLQPSDTDDFEIVSFEDSSPIHRTDFVEILENQSNCKSKPDVPIIMRGWQNDMASDLSRWLKPKKSSGKENTCPPNQTEKRETYVHNPLKNRFVDFPCLRTDPKEWVSAKRAKLSISELDVPKRSTVIFPPEHSLPATFWLKKYC